MEDSCMTNIFWKYVTPLKEGTEIDVFEIKYCFQIPQDLKECLYKNNGGVPSLSTYDFADNKGKVFGGLLSFNNDDPDNIYDYVDLFITDDGKRLKMFPFAIDPAGNFLCIENGKVVFYNHEYDKTSVICKSFSDFLETLY